MKNFIIFIITAFLLTSCGDKPYCIEGEDFGLPKFSISSQGQFVIGEKENQLSEWSNSGFVLNGDPLFIIVRDGKYSEWTSWFCGPSNNLVCQFVKSNYDRECASLDWAPTPDNPPKYVTLVDKPCIFRNGKGLYGLVTKPGSSANQDPNRDFNTIRSPDIINAWTFHLGDQQGFAFGRSNNLGGISTNPSPDYTDGTLYFKILDNYYGDNAGTYNLVVKSGVRQANSRIIQSIIDYVTGTLNQASEKLFVSIVANSKYMLLLRIILILFIAVKAISFVMGFSEMTQKEFTVMLFKYSIIAQLLTGQQAWQFFNSYFFPIFTTGLQSIVTILMSSITNGVVNGFSFFDNLIFDLFFSYETSAKIAGLFGANWPWGIFLALILVPFIYISIFIFLVALVKGFIFYLMSYIAISLIIILAPIFLVFILFEHTREFFEAWMSQLTTYMVQPLFAFASIALMTQVILNSFYKVLGFRVCWVTLINILGIDLLKGWQPAIGNGKMDIKLPGYTIDANDPNHVCRPYECTAERNPDIPFLDPVKDADYYNGIINNDFSFALYETFVIMVLSYLLLKMNERVPQIAKGITGTSFNRADLDGVTNSVMQTLGTPIDVAKQHLDSAISNTAVGQTLEDVRHKVGKAISSPLRTINQMTEGSNGKFGKFLHSATNLRPESIKEKFMSEAGQARFDRKWDETIGVGARLQKAEEGLEQGLYKATGGAFGTDHKANEKANVKQALEAALKKKKIAPTKENIKDAKKHYDDIDKRLDKK